MSTGFRGRWFVMVAAIALVAGACSSDSDDSADTTVSSAAVQTTTTDEEPPGTAPGDGTDSEDDYCAVARQIESDVGGDALEVDELEDHPDRYDEFKANLDTLDGLMGRMVDTAPEEMADSTRTIADAIADFNLDAQRTTSAQELIDLDPDFDSGSIGEAGDAVEDYADEHCDVDLDLD